MATLTSDEIRTAQTNVRSIAGDPSHPQEALAHIATNGHWVIELGGIETTLATSQKGGFRVPFPCIVTDLRASVDGDSSSGTPTFDVNKNGTTILSTKLTIDATEKTSLTATAPYVFSSLADRTFADDDQLSVDVDVAGTSAEGGRVVVYYQRTA